MSRYSRSTSFLLCRSVGHSWDVVDAQRAPRYGGTPVWLRCMRCGTERHDAISETTGELIGRGYVYEQTYRHAFDDAFELTPSKSDFRRMLLAEFIIKHRASRARPREE